MSCKLLIHFYLIIIVQCLSPYIVEPFCTASFCTEFFCSTPFCTGSRINSIIKIHPNPKLLSLLSTTMGLMHEPPLQRGMVNPWQTKSGTQCGAYGWWIGPFTYECDAELFHDITSHPAIEQYQKLAYVSWQAADTKSHMKNSFFSWENSSKHMTLPKQPTDWHLAVHNPITYFTRAGNHMLRDSAQLPLWDAMIHDTETCSIPSGTSKPGELPRVEGEEPISSRDGLATYPQRWSWNPLVWAMKKKGNCAVNIL